MKTQFNEIVKVMTYFFTPEDSATPIQNGLLSYDIKPGRIGIGSAKALFWVINSMIFTSLVSLL